MGISRNPLTRATVIENLEDLSVEEVMEQFDGVARADYGGA